MADRTVRVRLEAAVAGYRAAMAQSAADTRKTANQIQGHIRDNRQAYQDLGVAATAAGVAAAAGLRSVLSAGADYQASMNQVKAVSGATGQQFGELSDQARELGASTRFSASEAAEGMGFLAMAGFDATQTMAAMPGVLELAAAGAMDLGSAADIASNVLTGFGLAAGEVGRVNDVMAATFTTTNTDLRQLGEAMKFVAPVAASAGIEIEEVAAAVGLMGNAGIQASMAGTSLRGAITRLLNPSAEAADVMRRLGVNATDADGDLASLDGIVQQLADSGATTGEMMQIFGQRAGPAMAALVSQGADALRDQTAVALESAGTAAQIAETQMEGLKGSVIELSSAAEGLKIALFESGAGDVAEGAVDTLTGLVRALEAAPPAAQATAMGLGGVTAVLGTASGLALLAAPRIVATADAVRALGGVSGMASKGLGGLVRFGLHPATIALGIGVTALGFYGKAKQDARQDSDEFRATLDEETGALTDNSRAHVTLALEKDGLIESASELGLSTSTLVDAVLGEAEAMRTVAKVVDDARAGQDEWGSDAATATFKANDLETAILRLADARSADVEATRRENEVLAEQANTFLDVAHAIESGVEPRFANMMHDMGLLGGGADELGGALAITEEDLEGFGEEAGEAAEQVDRAADALDNYLTSLREATDPVLALRGALDKQREAIEKADEVMDDSKSTAAEREEALWDMFEADRNVEIAALEAGGAVGGFSGILEEWIADAGLSSTEAEILRASLKEVEDQAEDTAGDYQVNLHTHLDEQILQRSIRAIDYAARDRTVTIRTSTIQGAGSDRRFSNHSGGWAGTGPTVTGPPKSDEVDARLQLGEFILSRDMVAGRTPVPLFHGGGPVTTRGAPPRLAADGATATATATRAGAGGSIGTIRVAMPVYVDGRHMATDSVFINALSGEVARRSRNSAGAGL